MDKKSLPIIILLVLAIIFYWPILNFLGLVESTPEQVPDTTRVERIEEPQSAQPATADTTITSPPRFEAALSMPPRPLEADTIEVNTEKYRILLSTHGGGPVSIKLKEHSYRDGEPVELMPITAHAVPEARFAAGNFATSSLSYTSSTPAAAYTVTDTWKVTYTYTAPHGGQVIKTYIFYPGTYHFDFTLTVTNRPAFGFERSYSLLWNNPLGETEPDKKTDHVEMSVIAMQSDQRLNLNDYTDNRLRQEVEGYTSWAGVRAKYFAGVLIPRSRVADAAVAEGDVRVVQSESGAYEQRRLIGGLQFELSGEPVITDSITVFAGPMDYDLLGDYNVGLEDILDIGTTPYVGWIIKPFALAVMWLLPVMYSVIPNYGLVIILFALLVKIVTLPLSLKSFKSMAAMRDLAPKLEQLKTKYKNNPKDMNTEMLRLYKEHGVNPVSGCLPMLMQMPLFFALFSVFRSTILLRNAPFVGFISDLSHGATGFTDPYIILVLLMIGAQFLSQFLTMAPTQQNKMFLYIMPLLMGFLFYSFSAGLVIYWTAFSLFSLLDWAWFRRNTPKNTHVKAA